MAFENKELALFSNLEFPYSVELKNLRKQIRPNLKIDNDSQSLFSVIKYIRNDLIFKKLKDLKSLVFDKYINDILKINLNVDLYYPPENLTKLDKFITDLKSHDIAEVELSLIIYYILKDFSFTRADEYITDIVNVNQYNLINSIYFLDRFDILKCLTYLNSLDQFSIGKRSFINHIIRLANVIPFQPELDLNKVVDTNQVLSYLEIKSSSETALSVLSVFTSLNINPLLQDLDILLIYLDSITEISVNDSLTFYKSAIANYSQDVTLSLDLILKIILIKVLIKTFKQRQHITKLYKLKLLDNFKFNQIYESLPIFQLFNFQSSDFLENKIISTLYQIINANRTKEEDLLRLKFPNFWKKLDEYNKEIRSITKDVLALKEIFSLDTDPQEITSLSNVGVNNPLNPKFIGLKDLANYLAN